MGIEPTTSRFYSHTWGRCDTTGLVRYKLCIPLFISNLPACRTKIYSSVIRNKSLFLCIIQYFFYFFYLNYLVFFYSFSLYSACSKVGRGSLVLKHSTFRWRHCTLSGGTQHRALPVHHSEEMKILHNLEWGSNP